MALVLCYIRDTVSAFAWQYCINQNFTGNCSDENSSWHVTFLISSRNISFLLSSLEAEVNYGKYINSLPCQKVENKMSPVDTKYDTTAGRWLA